VNAPHPIAVHVVTKGGLGVGSRLGAALGAELLVAEGLASSAPEGAIGFPLPMAEALVATFPRYRGHVFVLAVGAAVRLIAPLLANKWKDPAVVCVDEAGRHAVTVLGGHAAGGNALCEAVARALGGEPVITTASDANGTLSVDLLGRELGWTLETTGITATRAAAAVVNGRPVLLVQEAGERNYWPPGRPFPENVTLAASIEASLPERFEAILLVTDRLPEDAERALFDRAVLYRPRSIALGVGCDRGTPVELVRRGVENILARHRLAVASIREVASIDLKADEPALRALAAELGCPLRLFPAAKLDGVEGVTNLSETVRRHVGTSAVAEPAALLAAGASALLVPKQIYSEEGARRSMTLAAARIPFPLSRTVAHA
jgi:cobalt-precorrin 5A hydrolase